MSFTSHAPWVYFDTSDLSLSDIEDNFMDNQDSNLFNILGGVVNYQNPLLNL